MSEQSFEAVSKDLSDDFTALRNDVAKLTALVGDIAKSQASTAKDNVLGVVGAARGQLNGTTDALADAAADFSKKAREAGAELEAAVERNPLTALIFAVIGGLIIGMMSRSRR